VKKRTVSKEEMVRTLKEATACEDYFPGVLGNPITFAARWGLPLSKSYLKFKQRELRAAKRQAHSNSAGHNGNSKRKRRTDKVR